MRGGAQGLHLLAADVLGRDRAGDPARGAAGPAGGRDRLAGGARRDLPPDHEPRLERGAAGVRAALRHGRARRGRARDAALPVRRPDRPRAGSRRSTRSRDELVSDSLVYRYNVEAAPDGLEGEEGTFSICSFWYVEALARAGRRRRGAARVREDAHVREPPRPLRRADRARPARRSATSRRRSRTWR